MQRDTSFFKTDPASVLDASSYFLKDYVRENLIAHGVDTDFNFRLMTRDSAYYLNSTSIIENKGRSLEFPIVLEGYLPKTFERRFILNLQFQDINRYFLSQLSGLTFPSILFLIGIIGVVLWALRTYYWQRRVITTTDAFINNLTHELKTPVFSINLASKMLEDKVATSGKTFLQIIQQQSKRLTNHIEKVLELATLERKKTMIKRESIDFYPFLEKVCEDFQTLTELENVDFAFELNGNSFPVKGESFHLQNMVNNLLDNAKKYAKNPKIDLKAFISNKYVVVEITDNGKGIPKEEQKRVFQKYYRMTNGNIHDVKGFGLGLHYVKTVVEQHKGKINLASELKKGTKITIEIPLDGKS